MSFNPDYDRIVTLEPRLDGAEPASPLPEAPPPAERAVELAAPVLEAPAPSAQPSTAGEVPSRAQTRPKWVVPAAIAAVGLIASGTLGYLFYTTSSKLDATRHQLAVTQTSLDSTKQQVASLQADAASKKVTADYVSLYIADSGKVRTDYEEVVACQNYSECRTAAQQALADMQAFQSDRQSASVPSSLTTSDGELGDSLSAAIAALQELIPAMDSDNVAKIKDGFSKLDDSMLSMAKAEAALGAEIH